MSEACCDAIHKQVLDGEKAPRLEGGLEVPVPELPLVAFGESYPTPNSTIKKG